MGTVTIVSPDQAAVPQLDHGINEFFATCPNGNLWRARRMSPFVLVRLVAFNAPVRRVPEKEFDATWGGLGD